MNPQKVLNAIQLDFEKIHSFLLKNREYRTFSLSYLKKDIYRSFSKY